MDFAENIEGTEVSDSIFDDNLLKQNQIQVNTPEQQYSNIQTGSIVSKLFDVVSEKINEISDKQKLQKLQKEASKLFEGNEDIFRLFYMFGCELIYKKKYIELSCPTIKLKGKITINENNEANFDENVMKIFEHITNIITSSNNLENTIDSLEAEGFYPIGELENKTIEINGENIEVMVGTLQNQNGETKNVYFYNGREIFLKPDEKERENK